MRAHIWAAAGLGLFAAGAAAAGPPYVTDDPEPTERGRWEVNNFVAGEHAPGGVTGEAGFDVNYGAAPDLQLTAVLPLGYATGDGGRAGLGPVELAAKLRVLHEATSGVDLAIFPRVFLPTPDARLGSTRLNLLLPVWAERDFGPWSVFGGGGYMINPGPEQRNFFTSGLVVTRQFGERLSLGGEVYHQGPDAKEGRAFTGLNLGLTWRATPRLALLAAAGPGLGEPGGYDFYVALQASR